MMPAVQSGDLLTVAPIDSGSIAPGDIVLFRHRGRPIAHRVEEIRSDESGQTVIVARGDGKAAADAPIAIDKVLGRVVAIDAGERATDRRTALIASAFVLRFLRRFLRYSLGPFRLALAPERSRSASVTRYGT